MRLVADGKGGLSPRVRGNLSLTVPVPAAHGSIPACAGEPLQTLRAQIMEWVYPRVCGGTLRFAFSR